MVFASAPNFKERKWSGGIRGKVKGERRGNREVDGLEPQSETGSGSSRILKLPSAPENHVF